MTIHPPALLLWLYFGVWVNSQGFRSHFNTFVGAENPILGHFETFTHQRLLAGVAFETLGSGMVKIPSMSAAIHLWGYLLFTGLTHLGQASHIAGKTIRISFFVRNVALSSQFQITHIAAEVVDMPVISVSPRPRVAKYQLITSSTSRHFCSVGEVTSAEHFPILVEVNQVSQ